MSQATCEFRRVLGGGHPLGQPLADFFDRDGSASFCVPNAFIDGGQRFRVFLVKNGAELSSSNFFAFATRLS